MKDKTYSRNFLSNVILKVDFATKKEIEDTAPKEFSDKINSIFPRAESVQQSGFQFEGSAVEMSTKPLNRTIWVFKDANDINTIELNSDSFSITVGDYTNFSSFKEIIANTLHPFLDTYGIELVSRIGLRYINEISLEEPNLFDWSTYLAAPVYSSIHSPIENGSIRRAMQFVETSHDGDTILSFKSGLFNSHYPAPPAKKEIILDFDCYTLALVNRKDIGLKISSFNELITQAFENSITESFRKILI